MKKVLENSEKNLESFKMKLKEKAKLNLSEIYFLKTLTEISYTEFANDIGEDEMTEGMRGRLNFVGALNEKLKNLIIIIKEQEDESVK